MINKLSVETSIDDNITRAQEYLVTAADMSSGTGQRMFLLFAQQRIEDAVNLTNVRDSLEQ